jgi:hypothetical protein
VTSPIQRPLPDNTQHSQETGFHAPGRIRTHNPRKRAAADPRLKEKSECTDEDKTLSLSLVPGFKKPNDDQKYWAKMEMLGIMRKAKNMVFQPQYVQ